MGICMYAAGLSTIVAYGPSHVAVACMVFISSMVRVQAGYGFHKICMPTKSEKSSVYLIPIGLYMYSG